MTYPMSNEALEERLGILGTSGSGKTYLTMGAIERLLHIGARVVAVDPLGAMWGLRLKADGKTPSGFNLPIFGGRHGDLPLNEHAGALIGETVATMHESCIVDLSELPTKAAERRFMTAFLEAAWRHTDPSKVEPYHLIVDEADRFAPQKPADGDELMLNRLEEIVRRGRIRGFTPWLITQRPAVLNKNVLSQVKGLIMLNLTSSQDREQVGAWIEGQADKAKGKEILASLPAMPRGTGVVWIPVMGILETVTFPEKKTFDSSRAPKRGEKKRAGVELAKLDLGALRERLTTIEAETKANDPKELKAEIRRLNAELAKKIHKPVENMQPPDAIWRAGHEAGFELGFKTGVQTYRDILKNIGSPAYAYCPVKPPKSFMQKLPGNGQAGPSHGQIATAKAPASRAPAAAPRASESDLPKSLRRALNAVAWWHHIGKDKIERDRAAVVCGLRPKASTFGVYFAELVKRGLAEGADGMVWLTKEGLDEADAAAWAPNHSTEALRETARGLLKSQAQKVFDLIYDAYPEGLERGEIAERMGLSPTASIAGVYIAQVAAYGLVESSRGQVRAADWLFP